MNQERNVRPFVLGVLLMDEWAASPNMGETRDEGSSKVAQMKSINTSEGIKTILSGQAIGSWHRQTLYNHFGWRISDLQETISGRDTRSFYTQCQPIEYEEDDGRGYLAAVTLEEKIEVEGKDGKKKTDTKTIPVTTKRTSPFMLSQFQSVLSNRPVKDFGILARGLEERSEEEKKKEGLIFTTQLASAAYTGLFALSLSELGRFTVGVGRDLLPYSELEELVTSEKFPYQSILKKTGTARTEDDKGKLNTLSKALKRCVNAERGKVLVLPADQRKARAHDLIAALADLEGGAHMTRRLYNVAPSTALVAFMNGGNSLPPHIIRATVRDEDEYGNKTYKFVVDLDRLWKVLHDNQDRFLQYGANKEPGYNLFFGTLGTPSIENEEDVKKLLNGADEKHPLPETVKPLICNGPREAIRKAASALPIEWFKSSEDAVILDGSVRFGEALLPHQSA